MKNPSVGIVMGSDSDLPVMKDAAKVLEEFGVEYEMTVCSAHRTPGKAHEISSTALERGLKVIIAGAGGAAHLAGVIAANTTLPVIGVPINSKVNGLDSLLSTVQMPSGVPVATVAIDGAKNAGLLAIQILATSDFELSKKLVDYKTKMEHQVLEKGEKLSKIGHDQYLKDMK